MCNVYIAIVVAIIGSAPALAAIEINVVPLN